MGSNRSQFDKAFEEMDKEFDNLDNEWIEKAFPIRYQDANLSVNIRGNNTTIDHQSQSQSNQIVTQFQSQVTIDHQSQSQSNQIVTQFQSQVTITHGSRGPLYVLGAVGACIGVLAGIAELVMAYLHFTAQ